MYWSMIKRLVAKIFENISNEIENLVANKVDCIINTLVPNLY